MDYSHPAVITRAGRLRRLHQGPDVLVMPDVWDAGSAALIARLGGVRALGTTSTGVAAAHGLPEGEWLTLDQLLTVVGEITRAVDLPVTVDLESGYGRTAADVTDSVASLIELGAAGIDIHDSVPTDPTRLIAVQAHEERIAATRAAGEELGVPIMITACTEVYRRGIGRPRDRFAETLRRLRRYRQAGADCVAVPGFPEWDGPWAPDDRRWAVDRVEALVDELGDVPLSLSFGSTLPSPAQLHALRVRRLSAGSALYRVGMAAVLEAAEHLLSADADLPPAWLDDERLAQLLPDPERA